MCFQIPIRVRAADLPPSDYLSNGNEIAKKNARKARQRANSLINREKIRANDTKYRCRLQDELARRKYVTAIINSSFADDVERDVSKSRQREAGELPADFFNPFPY